MKRLSHVSFAHPIPIPGTHLRLADFSSRDGWLIEDEGGCISLSKGTMRFYTYVSASCVEEPVDWAGVTAGALASYQPSRAINAPSPEQERAMVAHQSEQAAKNERKGKR